jgi:hypothetical protein
VKIYAATGGREALRKKERGGSKQDETQFITINIWFPLGLVGFVPSLDHRSHW